MNHSIESLKKQLTQLKELHQAGALTLVQYDESRSALERRLLDLVMAPASQTHSSAVSPGKKPSASLYAALAASVLALAGLGYWWTGSPGQVGQSATTPSTGVEGNATAPHATNFDQIAAMTDKLAERMKTQPDDVEGWAMLARSYSVLGKHPDALKAYQKAISLRKDDASLLADYADALAVKNNRNLAGEAMQQVDAALKVDPRNLKALALAGTHAFDRKDYALATKFWGQVVQFGPPDNVLVQQIGPALAEARSLAEPSAATATTSAATGTVSGTVSVLPSLMKDTQPDDTVFIFARAAQGSRMPLAILRKQVRDLPISFTLDDSTAMSPANALSSSPRVIVGARISRTGNAMPQAGDFSGQTSVVDLGASGLQIQIKDVVKP